MFDKNLIEKPQPDKEGKAEKTNVNHREADGVGYAAWMNYSTRGQKRCYLYRVLVETLKNIYRWHYLGIEREHIPESFLNISYEDVVEEYALLAFTLET